MKVKLGEQLLADIIFKKQYIMVTLFLNGMLSGLLYIIGKYYIKNTFVKKNIKLVLHRDSQI